MAKKTKPKELSKTPSVRKQELDEIRKLLKLPLAAVASRTLYATLGMLQRERDRVNMETARTVDELSGLIAQVGERLQIEQRVDALEAALAVLTETEATLVGSVCPALDARALARLTDLLQPFRSVNARLMNELCDWRDNEAATLRELLAKED